MKHMLALSLLAFSLTGCAAAMMSPSTRGPASHREMDAPAATQTCSDADLKAGTCKAPGEAPKAQ